MGGSLRGHDRVTIDYQAVGSGVGIRQIKSRTVDFGASDAPLRPDELAAAGLIQFPIVVGGVAPVVNVDGIGPGHLRLTGSVLADIYLGKIAKWNAGPIRELNPGLALPDQAIIPIHRADGSGTTFISRGLSGAVSATWRDEIGVNTAVAFPTGIGAKGNEDVAGSPLGPKAPSAMSNTPAAGFTVSAPPPPLPDRNHPAQQVLCPLGHILKCSARSTRQIRRRPTVPQATRDRIRANADNWKASRRSLYSNA
jgi:hypothetical protein